MHLLESPACRPAMRILLSTTQSRYRLFRSPADKLINGPLLRLIRPVRLANERGGVIDDKLDLQWPGESPGLQARHSCVLLQYVRSRVKTPKWRAFDDVAS